MRRKNNSILKFFERNITTNLLFLSRGIATKNNLPPTEENNLSSTELTKKAKPTDFTDFKVTTIKRRFFAPPVDMTHAYERHLLTHMKDDDAWISITAHRNFISLKEIMNIDSRVRDVGNQELLTDKATMQAIVVVPKKYAEEIMAKFKSNKNIISAEEKEVTKLYFV